MYAVTKLQADLPWHLRRLLLFLEKSTILMISLHPRLTFAITATAESRKIRPFRWISVKRRRALQIGLAHFQLFADRLYLHARVFPEA